MDVADDSDGQERKDPNDDIGRDDGQQGTYVRVSIWKYQVTLPTIYVLEIPKKNYILTPRGDISCAAGR